MPPTNGETSNHPFYSFDRGDYVQAGSLQEGERLLTYSGDTKRVVSKLARPGPKTVYNLEVFGEHVYFIGKDGVLVHNSDSYGLNAVVTRGTQHAETAWATKTGRTYDRWFRQFWRQYEGQIIGDGIEVASVNRRLAKGIQPDLVLVDHQKKLVNIHDITSKLDPAHLAKGETYVEFLNKKYQGYNVGYTESYWRGKENRLNALSSSGVKNLPGTTKP